MHSHDFASSENTMEEAVCAGVAGRTLVPTSPQAGGQWTDGQTDEAAAPRSACPLTGATRLPPASPSHRNEPRGGRVRAGEPFDLPERWLPDGDTENRLNIRNIRLKSSSSCSAFPCNSVLEERFIIATIRGEAFKGKRVPWRCQGQAGVQFRPRVTQSEGLVHPGEG